MIILNLDLRSPKLPPYFLEQLVHERPPSSRQLLCCYSSFQSELIESHWQLKILKAPFWIRTLLMLVFHCAAVRVNFPHWVVCIDQVPLCSSWTDVQKRQCCHHMVKVCKSNRWEEEEEEKEWAATEEEKKRRERCEQNMKIRYWWSKDCSSLLYHILKANIVLLYCTLLHFIIVSHSPFKPKQCVLKYMYFLCIFKFLYF